MAERKRKGKKAEEGSPDWLLTFGDLNSLLLTFFVFLLSMASFEKVETQLILSAFQGSFGLLPGGRSLSSGTMAEMGNIFETLPAKEKGSSLAKAIKEAIAILQAEIQMRKVFVDVNERGIVVSLSNDAYFKKGSAELDIDTARSVLEKIALLFTKTEYENKNIRIEGHTDDSPTDPNGPWPTNWHLSTGRALNVLGYLVDFGANAEKMSVVGYGDTQPIFPNDTEEHMSRNRRVDIVIMRDN